MSIETAKTKLSNVRNFFVAAMLEIGTVPTVVIVGVLVIALAVGGFFAWGGITSAWTNHQQEKELKAARVEKQAALDEKAAAESRATFAEGKLNEATKQKAEIQADYDNVLSAYRELRTVSDAARTEYLAAKKKGLVINGGGDLTTRFRNLSNVLDHLDTDDADPDPNR